MGVGAARQDAGGRHREIASGEKGGETDSNGSGATQKQYREPQGFWGARIVADEAGQRQADFRKKFQQGIHGDFPQSFVGGGELCRCVVTIAVELRQKV